MSRDVYQHFRPSERVFIDKVIDWLEKVSDTYSIVVTDFLNPRQCFILETLMTSINNDELQVLTSASIVETEYVKLILAPSYYKLEILDFDLACLQIDFSSKFVTLKHSQILGTLLGETGLDRSKIGDISVHQSFAQVCVSKKLVTVFTESITKIARSGVKMKEISPNDFVRLPEQATNQVVLMSSLRIDKAIASVFDKSRSLSQDLIKSGKVKVNYAEVMQNDFEVRTGDLISIRGLGRVKIGQNLGLTKKDKVRIEVQIISSQK
ncbi:RNA-binding protein [Lactococcus paracarnosus]|uniref:Cell division protein n=1 Tax=Pseudolactococcus paracarnosus TaxID=2749962 RepID=A0ABT0AN13_9LACT|nr:YlmH/Sll1252 family protein [Lactococcus paracarnosus]MBR2763264.1 DbpA RNA binding domain-containing protein [Lactococcus sp.]MCJ1977942.1 cell division protein [Lactococcus paracarnosus]MCJ1984085.1 cell division protein [Lactococcus paracarnosus]MCJ1997898.1 cell division protein [Lactococcus paracarnosus]